MISTYAPTTPKCQRPCRLVTDRSRNAVCGAPMVRDAEIDCFTGEATGKLTWRCPIYDDQSASSYSNEYEESLAIE